MLNRPAGQQSTYSNSVYASQMANSSRKSNYRPLLHGGLSSHRKFKKETHPLKASGIVPECTAANQIAPSNLKSLRQEVDALRRALSQHTEDKQLALTFNKLLLDKIHALTEANKSRYP